nr:GNAT family N-acetyltransferase [Candidatus Sigynarchaeota archaeon]
MKQTIYKDDIEFRTLHDDEFDQMAAVFNKAFGFSVSGDKYKARFKGGTLHIERQFIAVHQGMIVAGIRADYKPLLFTDKTHGTQEIHACGEINDVSTLPGYRRLGISRRLLNMAVEYMKGQGWELATLQANPKYFAKDLYESVGFRTLDSTGELYFVSLGSFTARWAYFKVLGLIFPVLMPVARLFAPQPPRHCLNVRGQVLVGNDRDTARGKDVNNPIVAIEIKGDIDRAHGWTRAWVQGVKEHLEGIQGLHEDLASRLLLDSGLNEGIPGELVEKYKKNGLLLSFIENGGKKSNHVIFYEKTNGSNLDNESHMQSMESRMLDDDKSREIIGGARYSVDSFQQGRIKVVIAFIDVFWLRTQADKLGKARQCLTLLGRIIGKHFPVVIYRVATGDLFLRDALTRAGFKPLAGGITMILPITNMELFEQLEQNIEPWILF